MSASANAAHPLGPRRFLHRFFAGGWDEVAVTHAWTGIIANSVDDCPWVKPLRRLL
jgi:hypothetical protein